MVLPDSINPACGVYAGWPNLTSCTIPDGTETIKSFENCTGLTSITIPDSVTTIYPAAFKGCTALTSIDLPDKLTKIEHETFSGCTALSSIVIPQLVTEIGIEAFSDCSSLESITIPSEVTKIEIEAFSNCSSLTSIRIPGSITSIGLNAFKECSNLKSIYIDKEYDASLDQHNNNWGASSATVCWKISNVDDTIKLGTYPESAGAGYAGKPIVWKALAVDSENKRALLISQDILKPSVFDDSSGNYKNSDIREYLNGDTFFSTYGLKKDYMVNVDVTTSIETTTVGSGSDYVFLLSKTEAENTSYFVDSNARIAKYSESASSWWLRSTHPDNVNSVYYVGSGGGIGSYLYYDTYGVRPAFWYTWE